MGANHYTVVIPTREHADTLYYTLKTCVNQDYDKLTILVCDNNSQDNTKEIVESFKDSRIFYINPGERLSMSENWEFALDHVCGDFVTFIGDDDGLLMGSINMVDKLFSENNYEAITWKKIEYCWSSHIIFDYRNLLKISLDNRCFVFNGKKKINELIKGIEAYNRLPCIYNSFVKIKLIERIKEKYGSPFFRSLSPDIYSSIAIAHNINEYLYTNRPLSVNGASGHSNGTSFIHGTEANNGNNEKLTFLKEFTQHKKKFQISSINYAVMDSLLAFEEKTGKKNLINRPFWANRILKELQDKEPDLYLNSVKQIMLNKEFFGVESTFENIISKYPNHYRPMIIQKGYLRNNNELSLDARNYDILNVFDASIFCSKLLQDIKPDVTPETKKSSSFFKNSIFLSKFHRHFLKD